MSSRPRRILPVLALVTAAFAAAAGCSSNNSSSPTQPVTGPTFNFTFPATGVSDTLRFRDVGTWTYHCAAHASLGMTGTIIVDPASTVDSVPGGVQVGAGNSYSFSPATVTIKPGGLIRWVNVSSLTNHTVTR